MKTLIDGQTSNVDGDARRAGDLLPPHMSTLPFWTIMADGAFDGATVKLQAAPTESGPWQDVTDASFTAAGNVVTPLSQNAYIRPVVSGAGASTSVSLWVG